MSAVTEILANINARRNTASNPVISKAVAEMLGNLTNTFNFDAEQDVETILTPLPKRFTTDAYRRMAWCLDAMLTNDLKSVERSLHNKFDTENRFESLNEISNELDEMYGSESNSFESGFEDRGTLHRICAILNIRLAYHENAEDKLRAQRKEYVVKSVEAQIGNPTKQAIGRNELANFRFEALSGAYIESDVDKRNQFDNAIIWSNEIRALSSTITNLEAIGVKVPQGQTQANDSQTKLVNHLARVEELTGYLSNVSDTVRAAVMQYNTFIDKRQTLLDKWYQDELNRIPTMMHIKDFCNRRVADEKLSFRELPTAVQIHLLDNVDASLKQTMDNYTSAAPELYRDYKEAVKALHEWLNLAIDARFDPEDRKGYAEPVLTPEEQEATVERSTSRRRSHKKLES